MRRPAWLILPLVLVALVSLPAEGVAQPDPVDDAHLLAQVHVCETLTRLQCMASLGCTMVSAAEGDEFQYRCRAAEGPCEVGYAQRSGAGVCEARVGCAYTEASCYCECQGYGTLRAGDADSPDCDCECAGGAPQICSGEHASLIGEEVTFFEYRHDLSPPAECLETSTLTTALLPGNRILFAGESEEFGGSSASLGIVRGYGYVPGMVYGVTEACLVELDTLEASRGYERQDAFVDTLEGIVVPASFYVLTDNSAESPPSAAYLDGMRSAWVEQGWDVSVLDALAAP